MKSPSGACIEVHRHLGPGFHENVYEQAIQIELRRRNVAFEAQVGVEIEYKGAKVGSGRLDLLVEGALILEIKAIEALLPVHTAQLIAYLKATHRPLGLLINFNTYRLRDGIKRIINTPRHPA